MASALDGWSRLSFWLHGCLSMSLLSVRFSRALAKGRAVSSLPDTREALLYKLLCKRAAAYNVGAEDIEGMLRQQILWSLPMFAPLDLDGIPLDIAA
jgi:hypothetical protein